MSIRVIEGTVRDTEEACAVLLDSVTGWAFGPTLVDAGEAEDFLAFLGARDPRGMDDVELEEALRMFRAAR
jgi:hypothetical protein